MKNKQLFTSNKNDWETPQWLFDELDKEFHFNLDVCANIDNTKCFNFFGEGNQFDDEFKYLDCFNVNWNELKLWSIWMNPPYGRKIGKFIQKAYEESLKGCNVVCLLPARTDTRWWWDWCLKAIEIRFLKGRLKFGNSDNSAPFPSAIIIFNSGLKYPRPPIIKWVDYKGVKNETIK
jgi:phage N-6-adenine-methyltransferase